MSTILLQDEKIKRPRTAYNLFFQNERQLMLLVLPTRPQGKPRRSHGKIGFAEMARAVSAKWKSISPEERSWWKERAAEDKKRHSMEKDSWKPQETPCRDNTMVTKYQVLTGKQFSPATAAENLKPEHGPIPRCPMAYSEAVISDHSATLDMPMTGVTLNDVIEQSSTLCDARPLLHFNGAHPSHSRASINAHILDMDPECVDLLISIFCS